MPTFHAELAETFTQATGVIFERIALFRRRQRPLESLGDFHATLSKVVVAKCDFVDRADSVVSDVFLTCIRDIELQKRLCMEQMEPEEIFRITIAYEMRLLRQQTIQEVQRSGDPQHYSSTPNQQVDMNIRRPQIEEEALDITTCWTKQWWTTRPHAPLL